jgi:hypothetical protein
MSKEFPENSENGVLKSGLHASVIRTNSSSLVAEFLALSGNAVKRLLSGATQRCHKQERQFAHKPDMNSRIFRNFFGGPETRRECGPEPFVVTTNEGNVRRGYSDQMPPKDWTHA